MTWIKCKTKDKTRPQPKLPFLLLVVPLAWLGENIITHSRKWQESELQYGKLHPGCYNTPPLQEDLVPRSRTERTPDIRNGDGPRVPRWLPGRNGATTSLSGI